MYKRQVYDTGSIMRFLNRRFKMDRLPGVAMRDQQMQAQEGFIPGDLTEALNV